MVDVFDRKVVKVRREQFEGNKDGKFTLVDPNGMRWFGDCGAQDYGPGDHYSILGKVTSGPAEWVGLRVKISGDCNGETFDLTPFTMSADSTA